MTPLTWLDNARVAWRCWRRHPDRPIPGAGQAIEITWDKPPAPPPGRPPLPGHHRGNHMLIDCWACGCIWTWTTHTRTWFHDFDCLDEELRRLLTP